jgi:hypothetical protein
MQPRRCFCGLEICRRKELLRGAILALTALLFYALGRMNSYTEPAPVRGLPVPSSLAASILSDGAEVVASAAASAPTSTASFAGAATRIASNVAKHANAEAASSVTLGARALAHKSTMAGLPPWIHRSHASSSLRYRYAKSSSKAPRVPRTSLTVLASFPSGCTVSLCSSSREQLKCFRLVLVKHTDGGASLQNSDGDFLTPLSPKSGQPWIFRRVIPATAAAAELSRGENVSIHLFFQARGAKAHAPALIGSFAIFSQQRLGTTHPYLTIAEDGGFITADDAVAACSWEVTILAPPVLSLHAVGGHAGLSSRLRNAAALDLFSLEAPFVLQALRAMLDTGAFYITGHGIAGSEDLFHALEASVGRLPFRDDALTVDDTNSKSNFGLVELNAGRSGFVPRVRAYSALNADMDAAAFGQLSKDVFLQTEVLCDALLHALALAQQLQDGEGAASPHWRGQWRNESLTYATLRVLAYHPGPVTHPGSGLPVVTTEPHLDSTWLTVLRQDGVGGLEVRPPHTARAPASANRTGSASTAPFVDARPPLPGALLVNCGNILQKASGGAFRAVCHRVVRTSATDTRVSLVFFYDRLRGDGFHAGGTKGC